MATGRNEAGEIFAQVFHRRQRLVPPPTRNTHMFPALGDSRSPGTVLCHVQEASACLLKRAFGWLDRLPESNEIVDIKNLTYSSHFIWSQKTWFIFAI